jgi:hypothetical protein
MNKKQPDPEYLNKSRETNKKLVEYDTKKKQEDTRKRVWKVFNY